METGSRKLMALISLSVLALLILLAVTASSDVHDAQAGPSLHGGTSTAGTSTAGTSTSATSVTLAVQGTTEECSPDWRIPDLPLVWRDNPELLAVSALAPDDVWAVGSYAGGTFWTQWNGLLWVAHYDSPPSAPGGLNGVVAVASDDVWATREAGLDNSLIMHWDGTHYENVPTGRFGINDHFNAVSAVSANDIWAVGSYDDYNNNQTRTLVEHWDGSAWSKVSSPNPGTPGNYLYGVAAVSASDVWAVGYSNDFNNNNLVIRTLVEHWDGSTWSKVSSPNPGTPGNYLKAVAAVSANDIWAVGNYDDHNNNLTRTLVVHWDGSAWSVVSSPNHGAHDSYLSGVAAVSASDVWAVGAYYETSSLVQTLIEHWDGSLWGVVSSPNQGTSYNYLYAVSADSANDVWAAGSYGVPNSSQALMLRYNPCAPTPTSTPTESATPSAVPSAAIPSAIPSATPSAIPSVVLTPTPPPTYPPAEIPGSDSRFFPQTGKTVKGIFLDYWNNHGGLAQQGYPISDMFGEVSDLNGQVYTVQYFQRAVFEYHPENQPPNDVLLSLLGYYTYEQKYPGQEGAPYQNNDPPAGAMVFPETGKWVAGGFLDYWESHGGLAQQGYPISNEFQEKSATDGKVYSVQYFQRAVFEYHPEYKGTPNEVLLSLLGAFRYNDKYPGQ